MNQTEFYKKVVSLPKDRSSHSNGCFVSYLKKLYKTYFQNFELLKFDDLTIEEEKAEAFKISKFIADEIIKVVKQYLEGFIDKAYLNLQTVLNHPDVSPELEALKTIDVDSKQVGSLYRMRAITDSLSKINYSNNEMFHVPFELRHLVNNYRYSITGYPCLYLGSSSYVCWKEMRCPPLGNIHISRLKIKSEEKVRFLNFAYPSQIIYNLEIPSDLLHGISRACFILWPLIAACSIKTKFHSAPFKVEYVIPQLLMRYIRDSVNIDGIRFFSTHSLPSRDHSVKLLTNYAIPVKTSKIKGHCSELKKKFLISDSFPVSFSGNLGISGGFSTAQGTDFKIFEGQKNQLLYEDTIFGAIEHEVGMMKLKSID